MGKIRLLASRATGVALHPEGVDRNLIDTNANMTCFVALHPEGVDRNTIMQMQVKPEYASPSTRRAWIEIHKPKNKSSSSCVALHPEGVDRNWRDVFEMPR